MYSYGPPHMVEQKQKRDVLLWTPTHSRAKAGRPARTYIQQLCEDTGCSLEDLPEAMNDREKWRERVRDIRATSTTWWWYAFFQAVAVSIWLYERTTWTLRKHLEKKLDGNNTRMYGTILNKPWKQHPTKQLYGHLSPISKKHSSKMNKTWGTLLKKQGRTHE